MSTPGGHPRLIFRGLPLRNRSGWQVSSFTLIGSHIPRSLASKNENARPPE
jgi:hypothetical protein